MRSVTTYHANLLYCYFCFVVLTFSLPPACKEVMQSFDFGSTLSFVLWQWAFPKDINVRPIPNQTVLFWDLRCFEILIEIYLPDLLQKIVIAARDYWENRAGKEIGCICSSGKGFCKPEDKYVEEQKTLMVSGVQNRIGMVRIFFCSIYSLYPASEHT